MPFKRRHTTLRYLLLLALSACAGANPVQKADPVAVAATVLVPQRPGAERYTTKVDVAVVGDPMVGQIAAEVEAGRKRKGQAPLLRDGRLDHVAGDIARATGGRQPPPPDAVAFLLWHYGIIEPEPNLFLLRGDDGAELAALAALRAQLAAASTAADWRRLGIGVERTARQWAAVVVLQEKNLEVDPVPRTLPSGGHATVAGHLGAAFRSPELLVTPPRGAVLRETLKAHRDGFSAHLTCNLGDGPYQVELAAQDGRGPRVLANFPVYCGVTPPTSFTVAATAAARASTDPAEVERQLLDLLDRDRQEAGLPPLVRDARLGAVARRYSAEMAETGEVAHVSPRMGTVVDRVRAAGLHPPPTIIAENVASAASAADAERAFMGSPGHRDNILQREITHVGVGVAIGRGQGTPAQLYFTQVFAGWAR